jgi:hypothetical protein
MTKTEAIEQLKLAIKAAELTQRLSAGATFGLKGKHAKEAERLNLLACNLFNDLEYLHEQVSK